MPRTINFENLDEVFSTITAAVSKGIGSDMRDFLEDNPDETHNGKNLIRGDKINSNLRKLVVSDAVELKPFKRYSWEGRILIDREHKITFTICTKRTLESIPKKKDRKSPHYLMSLTYVENAFVNSAYEQISFFPDTTKFSDEELTEDYKSIMGDDVSMGDGYAHLAIVYESSGFDVTYIAARLLDENLGTVEEYSLNKFLKPDFGDLTAEFAEEKEKNDVHRLITVKSSNNDSNAAKKRDERLVTAKKQKGENRAKA